MYSISSNEKIASGSRLSQVCIEIFLLESTLMVKGNTVHLCNQGSEMKPSNIGRKGNQ